MTDGATQPDIDRKATDAAPISRRRRRLYVAIAAMLPVLLLLCVEGTLRLAGYGGYPPVLLEVREDSTVQLVTTNPTGAASFFSRSRSMPGSLHETTFAPTKPANAFRIVLVGGSAIKGFPQPRAFAASAFLETMLQDAWPDRQVEVINLGTTAVASFPAKEMLREALHYEPDLAVVYSGHNEYFGAYGVASVHSAGRSPGALRFRRLAGSLAITQAADRLFERSYEDSNQTLMELVVARGYIGADDPIRKAAAGNLSAHLKEMTDLCAKAGVPIIVCTLPSNERDLAPLGADDLGTLTDEQRGTFEHLLESGEQGIPYDPSASVESLRKAVAIFPTSARTHYLLGRSLYATGDYDGASSEFQRAVDFDPMPWRAPSTSNDAIRSTARLEHATLCDVQKAFRDASPEGCIGWELMDDHVHPSLAGQALIARSILNAIAEMFDTDHATLASLPTNDDYIHRFGDNPYTRYGVAHTLRVLCSIPFYEETNPGALRRFDNIARTIEQTMSGRVLEAARQWQSREHHRGAKRPITGMVGKAMIGEGRFAEAGPLFDVAARCVPPHSSWNLEYVYFRLACSQRTQYALSDDDVALARAALDRGDLLLRIGNLGEGLAERHMGRIHQLLGEHAQAIPYLERARSSLTGTDLVANDQALVEAYVATDNADRAQFIIDQGIAHSGRFAEYYRRMQASLLDGAMN